MNQTEQKEFDQLREELASAQSDAEQIKSSFLKAMDSLTQEVRLYRGLFWCMLACATVAAILKLLQR
jgi:hypothetical protein